MRGGGRGREGEGEEGVKGRKDDSSELIPHVHVHVHAYHPELYRSYVPSKRQADRQIDRQTHRETH